MGVGESLRLVNRPGTEAINKMMAVTFDMGQTEQACERQILLHGQSRLCGQIFTRQQVLLALAAPEPAACEVDQRFVEALASFR